MWILFKSEWVDIEKDLIYDIALQNCNWYIRKLNDSKLIKGETYRWATRVSPFAAKVTMNEPVSGGCVTGGAGVTWRHGWWRQSSRHPSGWTGPSGATSRTTPWCGGLAQVVTQVPTLIDHNPGVTSGNWRHEGGDDRYNPGYDHVVAAMFTGI